MVSIKPYVPHTLKLAQLKDQLVLAVNATGGFEDEADENPIDLSGEEPLDDNDEQINDDIDDNIVMPNSEFIRENHTKKIPMVAEGLKLGIPQDKTAPYSNQWIELTDEILQDIEFRDYDIIAFLYTEFDRFFIKEPVYED